MAEPHREHQKRKLRDNPNPEAPQMEEPKVKDPSPPIVLMTLRSLGLSRCSKKAMTDLALLRRPGEGEQLIQGHTAHSLSPISEERRAPT